jgi:tRNA U34 2-thiouridine synthase MnmA/TrmU
MNKKAISLLSGGLDSILATRLVLEQGIEVEGLNFMTIFCTCTRKGCMHAATQAAETLKIPLKVVSLQEEYLEIIRNPKHGYGSNMNPCIDCRLMVFRKAKEYMEQAGAAFIVTGEVLGERPMSQRRDAIMLIERKAGLKGLVLRPLSAKLFEPTLPEKEGIIDREKLLDIRGRSRKPQIELAHNFRINDYPCPAGGCLLTDPGFAKRMKDLISHNALDIDNARLLKCGRHFRLSDNAKLVIGRDSDDNERLEKLVKDRDVCFRLKDRQGPFSIVRGPADDATLKAAAEIIAQHTKFRDRESLEIEYWRSGFEGAQALRVKAASADDVAKIRL